MKKIILLLATVPLHAHAGYGGMANVESDDSTAVGGGVIFAIIVSLFVLHYFGDRVLLKGWGLFLLGALVIGLFRKFVL